MRPGEEARRKLDVAGISCTPIVISNMSKSAPPLKNRLGGSVVQCGVPCWPNFGLRVAPNRSGNFPAKPRRRADNLGETIRVYCFNGDGVSLGDFTTDAAAGTPRHRVLLAIRHPMDYPLA